jgi:hypothetical protein
MPFFNTTPATSSCGVLSNENRVPSHWRLFAIIFGILRSNSFGNEIKRVLPDCIDTFILDIRRNRISKWFRFDD